MWRQGETGPCDTADGNSLQTCDRTEQPVRSEASGARRIQRLSGQHAQSSPASDAPDLLAGAIQVEGGSCHGTSPPTACPPAGPVMHAACTTAVACCRCGYSAYTEPLLLGCQGGCCVRNCLMVHWRNPHNVRPVAGLTPPLPWFPHSSEPACPSALLPWANYQRQTNLPPPGHGMLHPALTLCLSSAVACKRAYLAFAAQSASLVWAACSLGTSPIHLTQSSGPVTWMPKRLCASTCHRDSHCDWR
jgi:hypothetical protein